MTDIRLVIVFLGVIALAALGLIGYLAAQSLGIPDVLVAVASGAVASLGTLLTQGGRTTLAQGRVEGQLNVDAA